MLNKVILIGNVGKDPEVKEVGESKVATFSMATTEKWNKDGEKQEKTTWHTVKAWRKLAEIIEKYVKKGDKLYIEGKIEVRSYEKDGVKKYATDVIASQMQMLGGKPQEGKPEAKEANESDLPF